MKALKFTILMILGLSVPFVAISSDDSGIHKQAMEMHEKSQESVMERVQIPEAASEKATDTATYRYRKTELKMKGKQQEKGAAKGTQKQSRTGGGEGAGDMDRD